MRNWRALIEALSSSPRGYAADGRRLGLGLEAAMAKQRANTARDVAEYLSQDRRVTGSV